MTGIYQPPIQQQRAFKLQRECKHEGKFQFPIKKKPYPQPSRYSDVPAKNLPKIVALPPSYTQKEIKEFLAERGFSLELGSNYDSGLFQALLFSDPYSWESLRTRAYVFKKFSEFSSALQKTYQTAVLRYKNLKESSQTSHEDFVLCAHFLCEHQALIEQLSKLPFDELKFTQEKLCLVFFLSALIKDTAQRVELFIDHLEKNILFGNKNGVKFWDFSGSHGFIKAMVKYKKDGWGSIFSPEITQSEALFCCKIVNKLPIQKHLKQGSDFFSFFTPYFCQTGGQGINAILYLIFQSKKLPCSGILGNANSCYRPHGVGGYYGNNQDLCSGLVFHDFAHADIVFQHADTIDLFKEIYFKLQDAQVPLTVFQRKADLFILFLFVHEMPALIFPLIHYHQRSDNWTQEKEKQLSFNFYRLLWDGQRTLETLCLSDILEVFFGYKKISYQNIVDLLPLLKEIINGEAAFVELRLKNFSLEKDDYGFLYVSVAGDDSEMNETQSQEELKEVFFQETIKAIEALWGAFRKRHQDLLEKQGITAEKTPFLF